MKNQGKGDFNQHSKCTSPKCWSKYATYGFILINQLKYTWKVFSWTYINSTLYVQHLVVQCTIGMGCCSCCGCCRCSSCCCGAFLKITLKGIICKTKPWTNKALLAVIMFNLLNVQHFVVKKRLYNDGIFYIDSATVKLLSFCIFQMSFLFYHEYSFNTGCTNWDDCVTHVLE